MNLKQIKEFEKIIEQYQDQLVKYAFYRVGSYEDAQDIVQNTFIRFFSKQIEVNKLDNSKSYLYRCIHNACIDFIRVNNKIKYDSLESFPEINNIETTSHFDLIEEYKRINAMLRNLPIDQSEIVQMRCIDELSFIEIAEILKIPITTAKSRFKYGIEKLKTSYMKEREVNYGL